MNSPNSAFALLPKAMKTGSALSTKRRQSLPRAFAREAEERPHPKGRLGSQSTLRVPQIVIPHDEAPAVQQPILDSPLTKPTLSDVERKLQGRPR